MKFTITVAHALPVVRRLGADVEPDEQANAAGLECVTDAEPGCTWVRRGRGSSYHLPDGSLITGDDRERIVDLAVPPVWRDVWICPVPRGHLQATGCDDADRKQFLYHQVWRQLREATKFDRLGEFGGALPAIRGVVDDHLRRRKLTREKVSAIVVALLDQTLVRIGNEQYAQTNGARSLTTLRDEHVDVAGSRIVLSFVGKNGKDRQVDVRDRGGSTS